ncbi:LysE family translocator [Photorhabdus heterorhabditis]|uniref:Alcohol dehydrogenase n=1 Tax=Photorhabdus heterorhabditis TaxID=880156 RepID=A0A5B0X8V3_9GAMM|nr:LysE family translocator [Photorhabdus heterorhabditis]KAA1195045.1 LysE family translocator [Photorhabdus heterorhabditis]KOY62208.1 alcohol dehydrogenase [Photorhabdus heterorhabditis]MBS9440379.1 LysE family translocator [Photorhabdus heterorhabditis]
MTASLIFSLTTFLFISSITPGPNNMLLTSSGANFGVIRSLGLIFGILLGMQTILYLAAFGIAALLLVYPAIHTIMKIAGSLYLLWLAWKTVTASYRRLDTKGSAVIKPVRWYQGWLLQFLNPKAWLMGLGSVGSYSIAGEQYLYSIIVISGAMVLISFLSSIVWAGFGSLIGTLLRSRHAWFIFNIMMGILTAACVPLIWIG